MGPLPIGATLANKYRVVRLMADSGGLVLYEADADGQRVWIKVVAREALADANVRARFEHDATGAKVLEVGESDGLPFLVATDFDAPAPEADGVDIDVHVSDPPPNVFVQPQEPDRERLKRNARTVVIRRQPPSSSRWMWLVAFGFLVAIGGMMGWYLTHHTGLMRLK